MINFLEFQWIFFDKLVYNRIINRKEIWKLLYREKASTNDIIIWDIRNFDNNNDEYDRIVAFHNV